MNMASKVHYGISEKRMKRRRRGYTVLLLFTLSVTVVASFGVVPQRARSQPFGYSYRRLCRQRIITQQETRQRTSSCCPSSVGDEDKNEESPNLMGINGDEYDNDAALLKMVTKAQLVDLCQQCKLPTKGTKPVLLKRLRDHAETQAEAARQRNLKRLERVQNGSTDSSSRERYEIINEDNNEPDDYTVQEKEEEAFFYFEAPDINGTKINPKSKPRPTVLDRSTVTAPPPPDEPNNEAGERVRTIYSTTHYNDLTGVAAAQPSASSLIDTLADAASATSASNQPWDSTKAADKKTTSQKELDKAKEKVVELVSTLLAMTGAPAFASVYDDDDDDDDDNADTPSSNNNYWTPFRSNVNFVGFNPANVPADLLTASSQALRAGRGQVLQDVLRQFELQAIGQDGMHGDNKEKGGGHYREVSKVRAFLEGYRVAEVRRLAQETTVLLLDKLILEGVEGLDMTLNTMVRSSDDDSDLEGGQQLNDSLLDFLNDAIRQQEKKVDQLVRKGAAGRLNNDDKTDGEVLEDNEGDDEDPLDKLWNVTMENGQRVETLDPNDPKVKSALQEELAKQTAISVSTTPSLPKTAPERLLLLLTLLRERIKTEAAFAPDEKGRNLRLLAYCLRIASDQEREQLILKDLGNSLDRLDSFTELVASSIEYGESTSYELQPAKKRVLNVPQLKSILDLTKRLRKRQSLKASGFAP